MREPPADRVVCRLRDPWRGHTIEGIHDQRHYPLLAQEMPRGRFIYVPADEGDRERLFGVAALEFARVSAADGLPPALAAFEKPLRPSAQAPAAVV